MTCTRAWCEFTASHLSSTTPYTHLFPMDCAIAGPRAVLLFHRSEHQAQKGSRSLSPARQRLSGSCALRDGAGCGRCLLCMQNAARFQCRESRIRLLSPAKWHPPVVWVGFFLLENTGPALCLAAGDIPRCRRKGRASRCIGSCRARVEGMKSRVWTTLTPRPNRRQP